MKAETPVLLTLLACLAGSPQEAAAKVREQAASMDAMPPASSDGKVDALIALLVREGVITQAKADGLKQVVMAAPSAPVGLLATAIAKVDTSPPKPSMTAVENQSAIRQPEAPRVPEPAAKPAYAFPNNRDPSIDPSAPVVRNAAFAVQDQSWTDRIRLDGDIRVRWQGEYLDDKTSATIPNWAALATSGSAVPVTNFLDDADRARLRYRARLGFTAKVDDHFTAVIRLAAGNLTEPTSTDQTYGDFFNRDGVGIDRAYLQWKPTKDIAVTAGRMPNPFYTTNLLWDGDVNPEGFSASFRRKLNTGYVFATGAVFYLDENADDTPDRFVYAGQVGVAGVPLTESTHLRLAATYYNWSNYRARVGESGTSSTVLGVGNTLIDIDPQASRILPGIASPFRIVEVLGAVSQRLGDRYAISGAFDLAVNVAYNREKLNALPLLTEPNGNTAWMTAVTIGDPNVSEFGQWQVTASYRRLETDSIIAAFTEGDYNPGGTNRTVQALEGLIGLDHNAWLQLSYFRNRFITGQHYEYQGIRSQFNVRF
ncbi:putative porin [Novosphingobium resinovorum]|uniref:putative porin n=1 Tax=Novosphingobium resinovorum TaxID=158500 RepID=UPI002ED121D4|nr:putative porin [Novosphingobium resinovorum]